MLLSVFQAGSRWQSMQRPNISTTTPQACSEDALAGPCTLAPAGCLAAASPPGWSQ